MAILLYIYNTKSMEITVSSTKFDKKFAEQRLTCERNMIIHIISRCYTIMWLRCAFAKVADFHCY